MKIKLIYVPRLYEEHRYSYAPKHHYLPPMGIAVLKTVLENHGFVVDIDDLDVKVNKLSNLDLSIFDNIYNIAGLLEGNDKIEKAKKNKGPMEKARKMIKYIDIEDYDLIGLSLVSEMNISAIGTAISLARIIKEKSKCNIVLGGIHFDEHPLSPRDYLKNNYIDYIIGGQGITPFLNLCYSLKENNWQKYDLNRVFSRKKISAGNKSINHKQIPPPSFEGLPIDLYKYNPQEESIDICDDINCEDEILMLPYMFMKGCPMRCAFCGFSNDNDVKYKDLNEVVKDLKFLKGKYNANAFFFLNSNINPSYDYAKRFVNKLIDNKIDILWSSCAYIGNLDKKLIKQMRKAGAVRLIFGVESGSNKMLNLIDKGFNIKKAEDILRQCNKTGIWTEIELISGMPYEKNGDIKKTLNFLDNNRKNINFAYLNKFILKDSRFKERSNEFNLKIHGKLKTILFNKEGRLKLLDGYHSTITKFDELHGLKWPKKNMQINESFERIRDFIYNDLLAEKGKLQYYHPTGNLPLLFYLYDKLGEKDKIESLLYGNT
ncbi:MAG: radical SAM protein [Candidatus Aenigmatarchaeota archaeon]